MLTIAIKLSCRSTMFWQVTTIFFCFLVSTTKQNMALDPPYSVINIALSPSITVLDPNRLELECRNRDRGIAEPNAFFWLNGTSLFDLVQVTHIQHSGHIQFTITREFEGRYTCGIQVDSQNRLQSSPKYFIAFPTRQDLSNRMVPVASGTKARLSCLVQPGRLVTFYSVKWFNSSGVVLIHFQYDTTRINLDPERYRVDPGDLSLLISAVTPADTDNYRCVLGVRGRDRADAEMVYEETRNVNISLVVFDPPVILEPPKSQVVVLPDNDLFNTSGESVSFTCTATASQARTLEIFWWHEQQRDVGGLDSEQYTVEQINRISDNGITRVTSELTIISPKVTDSGNVRCEARVPPSDVTGSIPATAFADTTLSVLGGFQNIQPSITQDGNIFYDISLPDLIPIEVNLYILYQPQNDLPRPILIDDGFVNVSNIVYLERDPPAEIMNTGFSLRVALAARTPDLVMGPLSNTSPILDLRNRPLTTEEFRTIITAVSVAGLLGLFLAFIVAIFIVITTRRYYTKKALLNTATRDAHQLHPSVMAHEHGLNKDPVDVFADTTIRLYKAYRGIQSDSGTSDKIDDIQEEELSEDKIDKTMCDIKQLVNAALHHSQLKPKASTFLKETVCQIVREDKNDQFLINALKTAYPSVYEDVIGGDEIDDAHLNGLRKFAKDTLSGLSRRNHQE